MFKSYTMELGGRPLTLEFGKYAEQASGSTFVRYGDTCVLVNATVADTPRPGIDFFPLSVDFEEKLYSVGHIPGSWNRREGRPAEKAILTSRLIDRPLRPLFPKGMRHDVSVVATVMSVEQDNAPDIPAMIGASAALAVSQIPWAGPIGAVNVGYVDGEYVINPTVAQREVSLMNLTVAGTSEAVLMVEAGAKEVSEEVMLGGILFAHEEVKKIVEFIGGIVAEIGKPKKEFPLQLPGEDVKAAVREYAYDKVEWMFETFDRSERNAREEQVKAEVGEHFAEQFEGRETEVGDALYAIEKEVMRRHIIDKGVRPDGRKLTEVRPIWCEVGVLPRTHGSGVFTPRPDAGHDRRDARAGVRKADHRRHRHRGQQALHASYSNRRGEADAQPPVRREIGHGALAERALEPMIPPVEEFPYCLRLVSEVMSLQRIDLPGVRLWLHAGADGCRRADQAPRRRRRHGSDQGRGEHRQGRRADRHSGPGGLPGRHGLQGCRYRARALLPSRWTSRSRASTRRFCVRRWRRRMTVACTSSARCSRCCPRRAPS